MTEGIPECTALCLDAGTRRLDGGRTLIGGSPLRLLRLTDAGAHIVDDLAAGSPVGRDASRQKLARRLLDAGVVHPVVAKERVSTDEPAPRPTVTLVIPVKDHTADLAELLANHDLLPEQIVVVDDASADPAAVEAVVRPLGDRARLHRRSESGGPGVARNDGWGLADTDLVAFLDADVLPTQGWIDGLLPHFDDPTVGAVAPRVHARAGEGGLLDRYEARRSPLDLGANPANVAAGRRVSYLPSAAILYRTSVLKTLGGFDPTLRIGEDVDLLWRTVAAGYTVRYEPAACVSHRNRGSWPALARQRFVYATSAAALEARHPGSLAPVELDAWSALAWTLPVAGGVRGAVAGAAVAAGTTAALARKLSGRVERPGNEALRLAGAGNMWAGRWLGRATSRAWLPLALAGSVRSRRIRRATTAALVVPALLDWRDSRPDVDLVRWVAVSALDDVATCAGAWTGCWRQRSWRSLLPRLRGIPGL